MSQQRTALAGISHGTRSRSGQSVVRQLIDAVATALQARDIDAEVQLGHVDVQQPDVKATIGAIKDDTTAVVVPLLLSTGYHVNTDLQDAVAGIDRDAHIAPALGPDDRLVQLLIQRLNEAGADPEHDEIILGAAGSSDPAAVADCRQTAALLSRWLHTPVQDAYLAFSSPSVEQAVTAARQIHPNRRVVVASYLLAPGYFQGRLTQAGADVTTEALLAPGRTAAPHQLVDIVVDRFLHTAGLDPAA